MFWQRNANASIDLDGPAKRDVGDIVFCFAESSVAALASTRPAWCPSGTELNKLPQRYVSVVGAAVNKFVGPLTFSRDLENYRIAHGIHE